MHDLRLEEPPGRRETAIISGSVMLAVSRVLPAVDDPIAPSVTRRRGSSP
ncbi:hypothetical protein [Streptomyces cahuitamycinicus]|nr:hypothetical protein [Streptomyces cahuitamycinicus]